MAAILLAARLALSAVFFVAGVAKLRDPSGTRQASIDFGLPEGLSGFVAHALPATELILAAALLPVATARVAAIALAALLGAFTLLIVASILRGKRTVCHCFGETERKPVGWDSVGRNLSLGSLAVFIAWPKTAGTGLSLLAVADLPFSISRFAPVLAVVSVIACAVLTWAFIGLMRQHGRLLLRLDILEKAGAGLHPHTGASPAGAGAARPPAAGLPVGTPMPKFEARDLTGKPITLTNRWWSEIPTLLVFVDPNCGPCATLLPEIVHWSAEHVSRFRIAVVTRGEIEANMKKFSKTGIRNIFVEEGNTLSTTLSTLPTPSALMVGVTGRIASRVAIGPSAIRALVDKSMGPDGVAPEGAAGVDSVPSSTQPGAIQIGAQVPAFDLPRVGGGSFHGSALSGSEWLLLFWNPGCGFCSAMLGALREWEVSRAQHDPNLVIVSSGSEEANLAMQVSSPIVLDQAFALGQQLAARGTPSALLVDASGRVASEVAVGERAIWRLLGVSTENLAPAMGT